MATLDDLFGNKSSDRRFMKFENDGEELLLVQTGEPKRPPQRNRKTGKNVWLVQMASDDKYKPMDEGTFNEDEVENCFQPKGEIHIPVKVAGKKFKDGSKDEDFEPFETVWELTKDQEPKLKEAMMDTGTPAQPGTKYILKRLDSTVKPYVYAVKILKD